MKESEIVSELLAMVQADTRDRGDENRSPFLKNNCARTRELGLQLWELGGIRLMQKALGKVPGYDQWGLEIAWDSIGYWRS